MSSRRSRWAKKEEIHEIGDLNPEEVELEERLKLKQLIEDERYLNFGYENDLEEVNSEGTVAYQQSAHFLRPRQWRDLPQRLCRKTHGSADQRSALPKILRQIAYS